MSVQNLLRFWPRQLLYHSLISTKHVSVGFLRSSKNNVSRCGLRGSGQSKHAISTPECAVASLRTFSDDGFRCATGKTTGMTQTHTLAESDTNPVAHTRAHHKMTGCGRLLMQSADGDAEDFLFSFISKKENPLQGPSSTAALWHKRSVWRVANVPCVSEHSGVLMTTLQQPTSGLLPERRRLMTTNVAAGLLATRCT